MPNHGKRNYYQRKSADLKYQFGINLDYYKKLLRAQRGKCAICGYIPSSEEKSLCVDHCHKTHKIRGLLCLFCNTALGKFKDSPKLLKKAIKYLTKPKSKPKLKNKP